MTGAKNKLELPTIVKSVVSTKFQSELVIGVFWPCDVYRKHFGVKPDEAKVHSVLHAGKTYKGVTLEEKDGCVTGCLRLRELHDTGVTKERPSPTAPAMSSRAALPRCTSVRRRPSRSKSPPGPLTRTGVRPSPSRRRGNVS